MSKNLRLVGSGLVLAGFVAGFFVPVGAMAASVFSDSTNAAYYNAITKTADRLVALQHENGSWDWIVTDATGPTSVTYLNIAGVTAEGLISAYAITGKQAYLDAAIKAGNHIVSGIDASSPKSINSYNVLFLYKLSIASGNSMYATKAAEYFGVLYSSTPTTLCSSGCVDSAGVVAGQKANRSWAGNPNGIVPWDLVPYVEYAKLVGDDTHAQELADAIITEVNLAEYTSSVTNYDLGLASALKAAALVNNSSSISAIASRITSTEGSFGITADGKVQTTSYMLRAFKLTSDSRVNAAAAYLMSNPISTGGWVDTDGNEYAETDSEAVTALASLLPQTIQFYSIQDAIDAAVSGDTINVVAGTYVEDIVLTPGKDLFLQGAGHSNTTIQGASVTPSYTVTLTSSSTLDGFRITKGLSANGIGVAWGYQGSGAVVRNSKIDGHITGVYLSSGLNGGVLENNLITGNANGILIEQNLDNLVISGNQIVDNTLLDSFWTDKESVGIRVLNTYVGAGNVITGNQISGNTNLAIDNNSSIELNAENNWWGSSDPNFSSLISGVVDYSPWNTTVTNDPSAVPPAPTLIDAPTGFIDNPTPTFSWNAVVASPEVFYYQLLINNSSGTNVLNQQIPSASTSLSLSSPLSDEDYTWLLWAHNSMGDGASATGSFSVDTTAPIVDTRSDLTVEAAASYGENIGYTYPSATDNGTGISVTCNPPTGSTFPLGTTIVNCSATDSAGNMGTSTFNIIVQDTTPPIMSSQSNISQESPLGVSLAVNWNAITGNDAVDGIITANCDYSSGSSFSMGTTTVTCIAQDTRGNSANRMFDVFIYDSTAPTATVSYSTTGPTNQDVIATITPNEVATGETSHTFTADDSYTFNFTDTAGNSGSVIATVNNIDKVPPTGTIVINGGATYTSSTNVILTLSADDDKSGVSTMEFRKGSTGSYSTPESYSTTKMLTLTAVDEEKIIFVRFSDAAGNKFAASSSIILDTKAPIITIAPYATTTPTNQDVVVNASVDDGTLNASSHTFTENGTFTFIATDLAGNSSSETVTITNIDKTEPVITPIPVQAAANGKPFAYTVMATDPLSITFSSTDKPAGSSLDSSGNFSWTPTSIGDITFNVSATDAAGNIASTPFRIQIGNYPDGNTGGGGGGGSVITPIAPTPVVTETPPVITQLPIVPQVLGTATFNFSFNFGLGARGNHVLELQKFLQAKGLYRGALNGIFGPITRGAVISYQRSNGISATGFVGPLTRASLNSSNVAGASLNTSQIQAQIATLQAQVQALLLLIQQRAQ